MRSRCILLLLCLGLPATAQYDDDAWGFALAEEFGFEDMAETLFRRMAQAPATTRRLRGTLGLATLKRMQAERTTDPGAKQVLLGAAVKLIGDAVAGWPEDDGAGRDLALTRFVEALADQGRAALRASFAESTAKSERAGFRTRGTRAFQHAERILRQRMGRDEPSSDTEPARWRRRGSAQLRMCWLLLDYALSYPKSSPRGTILIRLQAELEEYILFVEGGGDDGTVPALHGYLIHGRTLAALDESDAGDSFELVIEAVHTSDGGVPVPIQDLAERALRRWLEWLVAEGRFQDADDVAQRVGEQARGRGLTVRHHGRWAQVHRAEAQIGTGRTQSAVSLLTSVLDANGTDSAARAASGVIERLVARSPDPAKLSPELLRAAARAAYAAGGDARQRGIRWMTLLLSAMDKVQDPALRERWRAEAWYDLARTHWFANRVEEARAEAERGTKACLGRAPDGIDGKLASLWRRAARRLVAEGLTDDARDKLDACNAWLASHPNIPGIGTSPEYDQAASAAARADADGRAERFDDALAELDRAIAGFAKVARVGGPRQEAALRREARARLRKAEVAGRLGTTAVKVKQLADSALKRYEAYLRFADDPDHPLTDPTALAARNAGRGEAHYGIARALRLRIDRTSNDAVARQDDARRSIEALGGFDTRWPDDARVLMSAIELRLRAHLEVDNVTGAERDLDLLRATDPRHPRTLRSLRRLGAALRQQSEPAFDALVGHTRPDDEAAWAEVSGKPGFGSARTELLRALKYYAQWCLLSKPKDPQTWDSLTTLLYRVAAWDLCTQVSREGIPLLTGADRAIAGRLVRRQFVASCLWADALTRTGNADEAARVRRDAELSADALLETKASNDPALARRIARLFGGSMDGHKGITVYDRGQGRFKEALELWKKLERFHRSHDRAGTDPWWEAKFNIYHLGFRIGRESGADPRRMRKKLRTLEAVNPGLGGKTWRPRFRWLERQMISGARLRR